MSAIELPFNDETLMLLNACQETELFDKTLKNALLNSFLATKVLETKSEEESELTSTLIKKLNDLAKASAKYALDQGPKATREIVGPLENVQSRFEEILMMLGGEKYRDHFIHSQRNFWIGLLLYNLKGKDWKYKKDKSFEDLWYLICRFHDFCYILQNIDEIVKETQKEIEKAFSNMKFSITFKTEFGGNVTVHKHLELLKYINRNYSNDDFLTSVSLLEQLERQSHSVLSAIFVIDLLHKYRIVPEKYDESDLKKIARAIALHNDSLTQAVLNPKEDFLAALLILVDEIQEWGRPRTKKDEPSIDQLYLKGVKADSNGNTGFDSFFSHFVTGSGDYQLPSTGLNLSEKYAIYLSVLRPTAKEFGITLRIEINNHQNVLETLKSQNPDKREKEILDYARHLASLIIKDLTIYANSIGLNALKVEPDDIIISKNDKIVVIELPLINKTRNFPLSMDNNLLCVAIAFTLEQISNATQNQKLTFSLPSNIVELDIPNLTQKNVDDKGRNLLRLNAFDFDWGIKLNANPLRPEKQQMEDKKPRSEIIFPRKKS